MDLVMYLSMEVMLEMIPYELLLEVGNPSRGTQNDGHAEVKIQFPDNKSDFQVNFVAYSG